MIEIIRDKLNEYQPGNQLEEENALKEILQDIALYGLWRSGFFDVGAFQGGTSLRILHGMNRFSEDLDFILKKPDSAFSWSKYAPKVTACFEEFGLEVESRDKARMDQRIRKAMIKAGWKILNRAGFGDKKTSTIATLLGESNKDVLKKLAQTKAGPLCDEEIKKDFKC